MTNSFHIVRRYSTKGGMEKYVWELTHALVTQGHRVTVVCEVQEEPLSDLENASGLLQVIELGVIKPKPRWVSMLRFSARVSQFFKEHPAQGAIIHSHERTSVHHVTTIHGPLIHSRKKRLLDGLSPRLQTWERLEKRELMAANVRVILPNSGPVAAQIEHFYPQAKSRLAAPALPGVHGDFFQLREQRSAPSAVVCFAFIGCEWKRKGLELLSRAMYQQAKAGKVRLLVAGPTPADIEHLFTEWPKGSYNLLGWASPIEVLRDADVLVHPAINEPFGMAIAEANAAGCRVIISENCGIAPLLEPAMGRILPCDESRWQAAIDQCVSDESCPNSIMNLPPALTLSWQDLAERHVLLYQQLLKA